MIFKKLARALVTFGEHRSGDLLAQKRFLVQTPRFLASAQNQKPPYVTHSITEDIKYHTEEKKLQVKVDPKTLKLVNSNGRPLCVMLCWLGATPKLVDKYRLTMMEQGYDVMTAQISIKQCLWPDPPVKKMASDLLNFCEQNLHTFGPSLIYGFSIGSYLWSEVLNIVDKDLPRYEPVLDTFRGQVWDSTPKYDGFMSGVAKAMFPNDATLAYLLQKYLVFHMARYYNETKIHYVNGSKMFARNLCKAPTLNFCSKADRVGTYDANTEYMNGWRAKGISVHQKVFEDSPHVQHLHYYPKEYLTELYNFLEKQSLLNNPEVLRQRIESAVNIPVSKKK